MADHETNRKRLAERLRRIRDRDSDDLTELGD